LKYFSFYIAISLLLQSTLAQTNSGSVIGSVTDAKTQELLGGVNVLLRSTIRGTTTNVQGKYQLKGIPTGTYDITFSLLGYLTDTVHQISIQPDKENTITVQLVQSPIKSEQVVVTASRREQSLREVPVSISTVSSQMIADHVSVTLDDALRYVPGVNMIADQVNIRGSSGYSRGVGSRVLILIDGLPYITGDTGEIPSEIIPMFQIDRIEVVKGAGSALYGSSALGGVINVITKEISETPELHFRLFSGIYTKPIYAQWNWSPKTRYNTGGYISYSNRTGSFGYLVSVSRTVDESFRENDVYHRWGLYSKFNYNFSQYQSAILTTNIQWRTHGNYFWWKSLSEATRPADSQLNGEVNSTRGNISFAYKEIVSEKFFYSLKSIYFNNFWQDDTSGYVDNVSSSHVVQVETQATYSITPDHVITGGMVANYSRIYSNIFGSHPGIGAGFYVQDELTPIPALKLTAGIRYDWQRIWKDMFASPTASSPSQLNPKIGLVYSACPITTLRASYGEGFRYPSMSELFTSVNTGVSKIKIVQNDSLKPERSISYEIGCSQWVGEHVLFDLALFQNDFYDLIEGGVNPTRLVIQFSNVTRARIRGFEFDVKTDFFDRFLSTDMSYTYIDPVDLIQNTILKFRPRHILNSSLTAQIGPWQAGFNYRLISRLEAIDDNFVRLAPIVDGEYRVACRVVDANLGYNLKNMGLPLNIELTIKNLTNYYYVELMGNLAPVRTVYLSIEGVL
jgi:outer membrane receptor for ferrienterochelin and colicins